jgi:hypothetical protein
MSEMGTAIIGTGEATGDRHALRAAEEAIANPLFDDTSLKGARGLLISITGGKDLTLYEVDEASSRVRQEVEDGRNPGRSCRTRNGGIAPNAVLRKRPTCCCRNATAQMKPGEPFSIL